MYIANQGEFDAFIDRARKSSVLAIDTEFMREKTYYAKLCLLQLGTDSEIAIVDPFEVKDLSKLAEVLADESVMKLFHAGTQDLEILYHEVGVLPWPMFDTQVAAALLGYTQQMGYGALVHSVCGVNLKKADSFTDWSRRPLTDSQMSYAADDVIYLPRMYEQMKADLEEKGRLEWLEPDFRELANPEHYQSDPNERFRRLKRISALSRKQMAAARAFAAWREVEAARRNIPRKWLVSDEQIVEACKREASSIDELFMVRGMRDKLNTRDSRTVANLMREAMNLPESEWPDLGNNHKTEPNVDLQVDLMTALVRLRSRQNDIAFQTLASHAELTALARGHRDDIEIMKGWRYQLIGRELVELLEGKLSLSLNGNYLSVRKRRTR